MNYADWQVVAGPTYQAVRTTPGIAPNTASGPIAVTSWNPTGFPGDVLVITDYAGKANTSPIVVKTDGVSGALFQSPFSLGQFSSAITLTTAGAATRWKYSSVLNEWLLW